MTPMRTLCAVAIVAAFVLVIPGANAAPTVHVVGAGSSALFQGTGVAAVNDLPNPLTSAIHHYSFKSSGCPGATCVSVLRDPRTNPGTGPIPDEPTNVWIVWTCPGVAGAGEANCGAGTITDVWLYHQVDSTVGVRCFFGRDVSGTGAACRSIVDVSSTTSAHAANAIAFAILKYGETTGSASCGAGTTCDDDLLPAEVQSVVNNIQVNAGFTDIRAEDAKAATKRSNGPASNNVSLGYGTVGSQLVGSSIKSSFSATIATPVEFGLPGLPDPFNNVVVPATIQVFPIGESPILFIANRSNASGLGAPTALAQPAFADLEDGATVAANNLAALFSAVDCSLQAATFQDGHGNASLGVTNPAIGNGAITLIQREPLSGTMNTTEWSEFRTAFNYTGGGNYANPAAYAHIAGTAAGFSQEYNVSATADQTLNKPCQTVGGVTGHRRRAIGTGELVNNVKATTDSLGYAFFSFGNVKALTGSANYGYLTIDNTDPLFANYFGPNDLGQPGNGQLPACSPPNCKASSIWAGNSFPNLRNGTYRAWSLLRMYCDTTDTNCTDANGAQALIAAAQSDIITNDPNSVADYLPYSQVGYIRAHYNLLGGTQHAQPFVHFFDQPMINPAMPASPPNTLDVASTAEVTATPFANGGDAGACIIPVNFASVGSGGANANDTIIKVTIANNVAANTVKYHYTLVSGTALTAYPAGHLPTVSVTGFSNGYDGVYQMLAGATATTFSVTNSAALGQKTIAPANPNGSAGNGSAGGATNTQCFQ